MVRKNIPEKKLSDVAYDLRKGVVARQWQPSQHEVVRTNDKGSDVKGRNIGMINR